MIVHLPDLRITISKTADGENDYVQIISPDQFALNIVLISKSVLVKDDRPVATISAAFMKQSAKLTAAEALNLRWNKAASHICAGSEFIDDPERVFLRLRDLRHQVVSAHIGEKKAEKERDALREQVARLVASAKRFSDEDYRIRNAGLRPEAEFFNAQTELRKLLAEHAARCPLQCDSYPCVLQRGHTGPCQRIRNEDIPD